MTGSAQHQISLLLSNWFSISIRATAFTFADFIKTSNLDPSSVFLRSLDILSLFTIVPLAETIQICADALYSSKNPPPPFPQQIFVELLLLLIQPLNFNFNKILSELNIMMTVDFLLLPNAALLSMYLLLMPLLSKLPTPSSADEKNSCTA